MLLADTLDILSCVDRGEVRQKLTSRREATLEEGDDVWIAANGVALPDASRIKADHVVPARELVDTLQGAELAEHLADAHARPARDEQQHALLASGVGRARAAEPKRELDTVETSRIDRHLEARTLRIRHVGAGRPMQFRGALSWAPAAKEARANVSSIPRSIRTRTTDV